MCFNKLLYGIQSISSSHSASRQLSDEFMPLHSIHILANLALKETVPLQSRTSPHVIAKKTYRLRNPVNSEHSLLFSASASCSKILNVKSIFNTVKNFKANSVFQGKRRVAQKSWMLNVYSIQWKNSGKTVLQYWVTSSIPHASRLNLSMHRSNMENANTWRKTRIHTWW